jgi:hypothetical protein
MQFDKLSLMTHSALASSRLSSYNVDSPQLLTPTVVSYRMDLSGVPYQASPNYLLVRTFSNSHCSSSCSAGSMPYEEKCVAEPGPQTQALPAEDSTHNGAPKATTRPDQETDMGIATPTVLPLTAVVEVTGVSVNNVVDAPNPTLPSMVLTSTVDIPKEMSADVPPVPANVQDSSTSIGTKRGPEEEVMVPAPPTKRGRSNRIDSAAART